MYIFMAVVQGVNFNTTLSCSEWQVGDRCACLPQTGMHWSLGSICAPPLLGLARIWAEPGTADTATVGSSESRARGFVKFIYGLLDYSNDSLCIQEWPQTTPATAASISTSIFTVTSQQLQHSARRPVCGFDYIQWKKKSLSNWVLSLNWSHFLSAHSCKKPKWEAWR